MAEASRLTLAVGADDAFALPLAVTLFSAAERLPAGGEMDVYVLDGGLSAASRDRLSAVLERSGRAVRPFFIRPQVERLTCSQLPLGRFGAMAYLRLLLPDSLPAELSHVLYLDSDLLVRDNLLDLWVQRPKDRAVSGVPDYGGPTISCRESLPNWQELGLPADAPYLNSGVLLINLDRWRRNEYSSRILEYSVRHRDINRYADQDGINAILCNDCHVVEPKWNIPIYIEFDNLFAQIESTPFKAWAAENRSSLLASGGILHFLGGRKPWTTGLASRTQIEWLSCMKRSGWFSDDRLCYLGTTLPLKFDAVLRRAVRWFRSLQ